MSKAVSPPRRPKLTRTQRRAGKMHERLAQAPTPEARLEVAFDWLRGSVTAVERRDGGAARNARLDAAQSLVVLAESLDAYVEHVTERNRAVGVSMEPPWSPGAPPTRVGVRARAKELFADKITNKIGNTQ